MRLASGDEVLVVRVLTRDGVAGYGFTFSENVAAARSMACWDAAAKAAGRPPWQILAEADPATRGALEASIGKGSHPWNVAWRAIVAGEPGAAIDWTVEAGFNKLHWIKPERQGEPEHG